MNAKRPQGNGALGKRIPYQGDPENFVLDFPYTTGTGQKGSVTMKVSKQANQPLQKPPWREKLEEEQNNVAE